MFKLFLKLTIALAICTSLQASQYSSPFGNKYWIIESSTIQPALDLDLDGKPDTDILKITPACEKDDALLFRADGTILTHRGKVKCEDDEETEEETGEWTYDASSKKFTLHYFDSRKPVVATLTEISANRIVAVETHKSAKGQHTIKTVLKVK
ncbi:lipocalin family protein [Leadbetterella byssophila]|uniref:Lipocalin-like domain-containing protein n=1 Tax=Leadbetterella byssophila (strain DSM 17132 / JCM 16389 / KACC 11308 / NBRC 106382 / 4M15) TaxID=649349 RepID=E4RWD9_LEAB4|nr:lipocalin family protein [Leadbetterella byssophila]ADQ18012.1 hypothetical protein Lbys_2336 [Leadbetterella byssophila DSM 17132]